MKRSPMPYLSRKSLGVGLKTDRSISLCFTVTEYLDRNDWPTRSASHFDGVINSMRSGGTRLKRRRLSSKFLAQERREYVLG